MATHSEKKTAGTWSLLPNGSEVTESRELIRLTLDRLKAKREMVTLVHKGYQSSKTVIVRYDDESVEIDKPIDWPGTQSRIDILFKDETLVWNQVRVNVLRTTADSIFTEFPTRLVRIQRRANYRVGVPRGSNAVFLCKDQLFQDFEIVDISANGILVVTSSPVPFDVGDKLADVHLLFAAQEEGSDEGLSLRIGEGRITRTARDNKHNYLYGVLFELSREEEKSLLRYVRQRERELLRKGLAD